MRGFIGCNSTRRFGAVAFVAAMVLSAPQARATLIPIGDASNYAILYEGTGGHNLQIANVTVAGSIGVGGTGVVQDNGPSNIPGNIDFSAANSGQFHNNNSANIGPASVNYGRSNVATDLTNLGLLSSGLAGFGNSLVLNGTQTVNESSGQLKTLTINGNTTTYRIFNVTSYSSNDGNLLTIVGDGSGNPIVFDFGFNSNVNLKGLVSLTGLNDDQVLFNFTTSGKNVNLNTNNSSFPTGAFQGIILAPNDVLSMNAANLDGRFFGGDSSDMQIVSHDVIIDLPPQQVPEPTSLALLCTGLAAAGIIRRRRRRS